MRRSLLVAVALMLAVAAGLVAQQAPAADPLKAASDAMGVTVVTSLRVSGFGANFTVGQSPSAADPWPRVAVKSYEATYNFEQEGMRVDITREQGPVPPRGGGVPFVGEQRAVQVVRGNFAWDEAPPAAAGGRRGGGPPPAAEAGRVTVNEANGLVGIRPPGPPPPTPQPGAVVDRMIQYWLEPHAFLRGAVANKATTRKVGTLTEVSYTLNNKYKLVGLINSRNEVEKVSTAIDNPVLGDMSIEVTYSNYQRFVEGAMFPLRIVQKTGGHTSLDLWVSAVTINPVATTFVDPRNAATTPTGPVTLDIPANVRAATVPAPTVTAEEIGKGIQYIKGGSHHSVAIEMRDHVILVEAPQNEARVAPVLAKVKELFPNKPIRFVVNTHHHFDHSGGLRTAVAEGATVVTHGSNRAYYQAAWKAPRTINPDKLAGMPARVPTFMNVVDRAVLTDTPRRADSRVVEIHRMQGNPHNDGFLMVYLPAEKLLIEADAYTPPAPPAAAPAAGAGAGRAGGDGAAAGGRAGGAPAAGGRGGAPAAPAAPPPPNPATVNMLDNITRLKLDVAQIAPLHGARLATLEDVRTAVNPPAPAPAAPAAGRGQ
jgi:glyoxylase-like metal-dependent hydrolase (beta-lactamase superfamily II)